jgi:hypothetical protein
MTYSSNVTEKYRGYGLRVQLHDDSMIEGIVCDIDLLHHEVILFNGKFLSCILKKVS